MTNRKKRLKKGIDSLSEKITLHEEKMRTAADEGNIELADYYFNRAESPALQGGDGCRGKAERN